MWSKFEGAQMTASVMPIRRAFPALLPVVDKLRTVAELDPETLLLLPCQARSGTQS